MRREADVQMLIAVKPHSINPSRASFGMAHALWSLKDNKLAATADSTIVMYDYDHKKKGKLSEEFMKVLEARSGQKRVE
jgi:acyl-CoA thioesterase FadM